MSTVPVTYRPALPSDAAAIVELWNDRFGSGCADPRLVEDAVSPDLPEEWAIVADVDGRVGGFVTAAELSLSDFLDDVQADPSRLPDVDTVAELGVIAVDRQLGGRGIGKRLTQLVIDDVDRRGHGRLYTVSWLKDRFDSSVLFESLGFERVEFFPRYWADTAVLSECNECGGRPCTCDAALYCLTFE